MGITEADRPIIISEDAARGGVTGHHARYVLVWGLTGIIAAFAAIAMYFGYNRIAENVSRAFAQSPSEVLQAFAPYAMIVLAGAIVAGLLLGVWNMMAGRSDNATQYGMRLRVVAQFALICVIMAILFASAA
ncbi:MAG: twin transmembrane helix small protein [Hyphomicrobium sp.]